MVTNPVLSSRRWLLFGLIASAALYVVGLGTLRIKPASPKVAVRVEGSFQPNGWYPGEPFANAPTVRAWGSWSGSDENVGTLSIGPFTAPRILRFGLSG